MTSFAADAADERDRGGPQQPLLTVTDLRKYFPIRGGVLGRTVAHVRAVDGVSFTVRKGETLGIVGESGCGKSTVARLLMRLVDPDAGEQVFDGEAVGEQGGISVAQMRRQVQMVFQDSASSLNPRMPVQNSIAFGPVAFGARRADAVAMARELLTKVGLNPVLFGGRYPHELSGGQKQRINIARALALKPRMIILDEAVSALDKSVEAQVLNLLQALKRELNLTYVFISHDLGVVRWISDRVMVMYLGEVVEIGPADAIYTGPKHPYTRALLASRPALDPDQRREEAPVSGDPPNPVNPPSGCRFHTRCPHAEPVCSARAPSLGDATGFGHLAACHMQDAGSGHTAASVLQ
ncbi:ABC transporter ATP-binding protein [Humitalea rosea]|nr:oligopeptide/dipeptide ABC transporter ATP-binding protein [Humitalea rosea]